jgi:hypothetical protein
LWPEIVVRPGTRAMHVIHGGPKVQETMFSGEDYKGEQPLFFLLKKKEKNFLQYISEIPHFKNCF